MPAPGTIEDYVELVRKSEVVESQRLASYVAKRREESSLPATPGQFANEMIRDGLLTVFQAEQILAGKWRRFHISDKYKLLEHLGSGGMGSVYLCEHKSMRRRVSIKVLPANKSKDVASLERFYREARAVAALDHPNIVRAHDIDHDGNLHFLVMEYVDGSSLQDIVKRNGPIDIERAAHYITQAAYGLEHANEGGIVHRDIKPGNLLLDRSGTLKILDMGLARFFNDDEDITKKHEESVLGTADYLAPEQALDSNVDIRADIYSLGVTFYFMLTGTTPFSDGTAAQKLIWHQVRQPKPVRTLRPEVPEELEAIINKMLAKDPAQRFQTPLEVIQALEPWTRNSIDPPPDKEMPRLCLAAGGSETGSASGKFNASTGHKNTLASPDPRRRTSPKTMQPGRSSPLPSGSDLREKASPLTQVQGGKGPQTLAPAKGSGTRGGGAEPHIDSPTVDTEDLTAQADTTTDSSAGKDESSSSRRSRKSGRRAAKNRNQRVLWIVGVSIVASLVSTLMFWGLSTLISRPPREIIYRPSDDSNSQNGSANNIKNKVPANTSSKHVGPIRNPFVNSKEALLSAEGVSIKIDRGVYRILAPRYEALVESDGMTSLQIDKQEFLQPGVQISRGLYLFQQGEGPTGNGVLDLPDRSQPAPNVIVALGDRAAIKYEFGKDLLRISVKNHTPNLLAYFGVFDFAVDAVEISDGTYFKIPFESQSFQTSKTTTFFAGKSKLKFVNGDRTWGPWIGAQVWEGLYPDELRVLQLEVGATTPAESAKIAELQKKP